MEERILIRFTIYKGKEGTKARRNIADIKSKLENEGKLLVLGQSGSSKSTIFMEIICDYFDEGFAILYNEGTTDIKNPDGLVNFIEDLLKDERKVLVAIDNAHDEKTSSIFYVIDKFSTSQMTTNLMFIITARMPEFDLFAKDRLDREQEQIRKSIRKLIGDTKFRYQVPYFSKGEIKNSLGYI